jgi:hypothetical protein
MQEHDPIEERMRTEALAPADEAFTRRVLAVLPPRRQVRSRVGRRSFALSMRAGLALAVVVGAQRWLASKPGDVESLLAVLLIVAPVAAAISRLCGPWIPPSIQRLVWRAGRDWR